MLPDFQYVLAHPDILTELSAIRGLLRKRYPNLQHGLLLNCSKDTLAKYKKHWITGSLTLELVAMIKHYIKGIKYNMQVDPFDESLGIVEMKIGQVKYNLFLLSEVVY